jgi:hypothetical protein
VFEEWSIHSIDMDSYERGIDLMLNVEFEETGKHKENILGLETDIERANEGKFESYKEAVEGANLHVWGEAIKTLTTLYKKTEHPLWMGG